MRCIKKCFAIPAKELVPLQLPLDAALVKVDRYVKLNIVSFILKLLFCSRFVIGDILKIFSQGKHVCFVKASREIKYFWVARWTYTKWHGKGEERPRDFPPHPPPPPSLRSSLYHWGTGCDLYVCFWRGELINSHERGPSFQPASWDALHWASLLFSLVPKKKKNL